MIVFFFFESVWAQGAEKLRELQREYEKINGAAFFYGHMTQDFMKYIIGGTKND